MKKALEPPRDMLTIGEAAQLLGVSLNTLRRWDAAGHFRADRNSANARRLYSRTNVARLRQHITRGEVA
jgi:excisionase family DNA binding protein